MSNNNNTYDESLTSYAAGRGNLTDLYNELKKDIFIFAYSIVGDYHLAEDIMQDTFLRIQTKADTYKKGTNTKAWIMTITRNLSYNAISRRRREISIEDYGDIPAKRTPEDEAESIIDVAKALSILSEEERQILILHDVTGLMHKEIAVMLGFKPGTVRKKYTRLIKKLYDYYKGCGRNDI